jgi:hypothetical protein
MLVDPEDSCDETISLETQADLAQDTIGVALQENYGAFIRYMEFLALEDQELINLYYQAEKPQWCLATFHRSTQTLCSQRLRLAVKRLALMAMFQGPPSLEVLEAILEEHQLNRLIPNGPTTGQLVVEYRKHHSFSVVTDVLHCSRPQVRRALISSAATLLKDEHEEHTAFGAYIHGLIDQASVLGPGYSENKRMKCSHGFVSHPAVVGEARIQLDDIQDYGHVLVSRASL